MPGRRANVIAMPARDDGNSVEPVTTPWAALGFKTERDMLIDDLKALDRRTKDPCTAAHAIAALSKRKQEIFEQIKLLDAGDDPDAEILDDSDDEAWDAGG